MLAELAGAATIGGVNNMLSEYHANKAHKRQLELMEKQNAMNRVNALSAYSTQVQGMRMAGLNPASLDGSGNPNVAAAVSQGAAAKGENVEMDPASLLLKAQADNLNADTAKKRAEIGNVNQDTDLKFAQKLFTNENADKVNKEAQNIQNVNDTYADTNRFLLDFSRGMAEKWQSSEWYNKLAPRTRDTIDAIASGEMPLTVGGIQALQKTIEAQSGLSDSDRKLVANAFDNAVIESMFNDKSVMSAIVKEPKNRQDKLKAEVVKLNAELPEVRARVANLLDDLKSKKLSREDLRAKIDAFKRNDLGYLKSKGDYGKWFEGYAEQMLLHLLPLAAGGAAARGFGSSKTTEKVTSSHTTPPIYDAHGGVASPAKTYTRTDGVQSFRW